MSKSTKITKKELSATRTEEEKERKFLLKRFPRGITFDKIIAIQQFYVDGWRYRSELDINNPGAAPKYYKLKKESLGVGINKEVNIEEISFSDFLKARGGESANKISKNRFVYNYKGKKFEIDSFIEIVLIMMEVEDVDMKDVIEFPPEIEKEILMEVTGNKNFDNYSLGK